MFAIPPCIAHPNDRKGNDIAINGDSRPAIYLIKVIARHADIRYLCNIKIELISHNFIT